MSIVYLSLGSNLSDRLYIIQSALQEIRNARCNIEKTSLIYETESWGYSTKNTFLNVVIEITTNLAPLDLLNALQTIENLLGRSRKYKNYQDRIIDIDILFYEHIIICNENLLIPHIFMHKRKFCVVPMCEISNTFVHPILKKNMIQLLQECQDESFIKPFHIQLT